MKEVKSLIERATKYLKSSKVLFEEEDYESSVSRAYYAMFYSAESLQPGIFVYDKYGRDRSLIFLRVNINCEKK